ncbi:FAD-binding oxidoreductase [Pseudomonas sp. Irchel s3b6]|uniref:NAD(P)/FAD-dependent oxidoreductase n=1 Tax=Pseudomonas sp. Irchel s3b6 TaxID=2009078 RepID=UPI000BA3701A|nr:FAD-binding oxidoreductase [Pseudomonas sp. Irchel s3b6]
MTENTCGWIAQTPPSAAQPPLHGRQTADWLIIGGGFTGLSAAHTLAELHPQARIVIVDRQRAAQGSSARNSGFVVAHENPAGDDLLGRPGHDYYQASTQISRAASEEVRRRVSSLGIACDLQEQGYFFAVHDPAKLEDAALRVQTLRNAGADALLLQGQALSRCLGTEFYRAGIWCRGGNALLQPAKYAKGLRDTLPESVSVYEYTDITALTRLANGNLSASSAQGRVEAPQVLICVGPFLPRVGVREPVFPLELSASLTHPLSDEEFARMGNPQPWGVLSTRPAGATLRLTVDRRLLIRNTVEFRSRDLDGAALGARRQTHLRGLQRRFPWITEQHFQYSWTGHLSATRSGEPRFARLERGIHTVAGCNGSGVARGTLWGRLLAEMASGSQSPLLDNVLAQAEPGWLPPAPFFDIGASVRLRYEACRAKSES